MTRKYFPNSRTEVLVLPDAPERGIIVSPVDWMGHDRTIAQAFWSSTDKDAGAWTCPDSEIGRVIDFGMKAQPVPHGTPFGHGHLMLHFERVPIVLVNQLLRARVQLPSGEYEYIFDWAPNISQKSGRYTAYEIANFIEQFLYIIPPEEMRVQVGRPGHYTYQPMDARDAAVCYLDIYELYKHMMEVYSRNLSRGLANEQARFFLPQSTYTRLYLTASIRNWYNWCVQRHDAHAQQELRDAAAIVDIILAQLVPITHNLWESRGRRII